MAKLGPRGYYSIQQVSELSGLSKQVIRKWEERYNLVQPIRLENGYRRYDEHDLNLILNAKGLTDQGYSIKQAAAIVKEEDSSSNNKQIIEKSYFLEHLNTHVLDLLEKGKQCNEMELNSILQQAYLEFGLEKFLQTVVKPFMFEVGNKWGSGEWDEYQESVSSLVVRDFLVQLRRAHHPKIDAPLILGACLPYERHEIPLHIILLQFMMKGWRTILVGGSPAPGSIEKLITKLKPEKVLLSAVTNVPFKKNPLLLKELDTFASVNKDIDFYLGGPGGIEYAKDTKLLSIKLADSINKVFEADSERK